MKRYTGSLNVFRESSTINHLSANLVIDGKTFYWDKSPKCFGDLFNKCSEKGNLFIIEVSLNNDMQNPRNVVMISQS